MSSQSQRHISPPEAVTGVPAIWPWPTLQKGIGTRLTAWSNPKSLMRTFVFPLHVRQHTVFSKCVIILCCYFPDFNSHPWGRYEGSPETNVIVWTPCPVSVFVTLVFMQSFWEKKMFKQLSNYFVRMNNQKHGQIDFTKQDYMYMLYMVYFIFKNPCYILY